VKKKKKEKKKTPLKKKKQPAPGSISQISTMLRVDPNQTTIKSAHPSRTGSMREVRRPWAQHAESRRESCAVRECRDTLERAVRHPGEPRQQQRRLSRLAHRRSGCFDFALLPILLVLLPIRLSRLSRPSRLIQLQLVLRALHF
jgi:hypothetical protein